MLLTSSTHSLLEDEINSSIARSSIWH